MNLFESSGAIGVNVNLILPLLVVACLSSVLLAQPGINVKQPDVCDETEAEGSSITLPVCPAGKYALLSQEERSIGDFRRFVKTLPFTWIEAEWTERGNSFRGEPDVHHRLRISRDRSALHVTASVFKDLKKDRVKNHIYRKGKIFELQYGKICFLLEQFDVGSPNCTLGRLTAETDDPFATVFANHSELRVHVAATDSIHTYQNDDGGVGDYRYWLVQTVIKQLTREDMWWTVPSPDISSEQSREPELQRSSN